jgi:predicted nuclease of predicted toxin-antitoxin system
VIFWIDAQLPPSFAPWLTETFNVQAQSLKFLGLRNAEDETIFEAARQQQVVIVSKDSDFVELVLRFNTPPQILWVTHLTQHMKMRAASKNSASLKHSLLHSTNALNKSKRKKGFFFSFKFKRTSHPLITNAGVVMSF